MAMPGGGYGGYGGPDDYYHQDANGDHGGGGGHALSNGNGDGVRGVSGVEHEQDDAEEIRRLHAHLTEVDIECQRHQFAANETQTLLENRAIARLATEREVKELKQQHEEKLEMYREKERMINEACVIGDNRIKELQERQKRTEADMRESRRKRRAMIDQAKVQERKAIINEERRRHASAGGTGSSSSNGGTASPAAAAAAAAASFDGKIANGGSMGRRAQSSTGATFAPRRASTGAGAGAGTAAETAAAQRSKRSQGKPGGSGAQPKPFDKMRQTFVEDTLTDFFGL